MMPHDSHHDVMNINIACFLLFFFELRYTFLSIITFLFSSAFYKAYIRIYAKNHLFYCYAHHSTRQHLHIGRAGRISGRQKRILFPPPFISHIYLYISSYIISSHLGYGKHSGSAAYCGILYTPKLSRATPNLSGARDLVTFGLHFLFVL